MAREMTPQAATDAWKLASNLFAARQQIAQLKVHESNLNSMLIDLTRKHGFSSVFMIKNTDTEQLYRLEFNMATGIWIVAIATEKADNLAPFKFFKDRG